MSLLPASGTGPWLLVSARMSCRAAWPLSRLRQAMITAAPCCAYRKDRTGQDSGAHNRRQHCASAAGAFCSARPVCFSCRTQVPAAGLLLSPGRCPSLPPSQLLSCCAAWAGTPRWPHASPSSRPTACGQQYPQWRVCQRGGRVGESTAAHHAIDVISLCTVCRTMSLALLVRLAMLDCS